MRRHSATALLFLVPLLSACSTTLPTRKATPPSPETPAVLGTAIIAPDRVVPAVTDAVRADPGAAATIAGAATVAAPTQAAAIRSAAINEAPGEAAAVTRATRAKAPNPPANDIPRHERLAAIVEASEFSDASKTARFSLDGFTRIGGEVTRSLAALSRAVRQFVTDLW